MKHRGYNEIRQRGRFDFPIEYHYVDCHHLRFNMPYHWHVEYELIRILHGTFSLSLNETSLQAGPGDVFFIRDGIVHGGTPNQADCVYECLVFDAQHMLKEHQHCNEAIDSILQHDLHINKHLHPNQEGMLYSILDNLFTAMKTPTPGYELIVLGAFYAFFGVILQQGLYHPARFHNTEMKFRQQIHQVKQAFTLIETSYGSPLTLQDLADAAGFSPNYFCRFFQKMTQRSPIDYLNYYRIEIACRKLHTDQRSITEIAYECGFNDLSYFIKTFHKYKGTSPHKYKKESFFLESTASPIDKTENL